MQANYHFNRTPPRWSPTRQWSDGLYPSRHHAFAVETIACDMLEPGAAKGVDGLRSERPTR